MATEKRYIEVNALMENRIWKCGGDPYDQYYMGYQDALDNVEVTIDNQPTADVVPVDDIKLHHILIDQNGIPEVKLQFGDRTLILRREGDPVDVRELVHYLFKQESYQNYTTGR